MKVLLMLRIVLTLLIAWTVIGFALPTAAQERPAAAHRPVDFMTDVRPLLKQRCWACHGSEEQQSGLRLDRREWMLQGGDQGRVVEPGRSAASRLIQYVTGAHPDKVMPPEGDRLSVEQIEILAAWIDQGCVWPESATDPTEENRHWAYQPLPVVVPPQVEATDWPRNDIDRFVLAELEKHGLSPSPEASRYTLIRRLYLDLTGLLPSVDEVDDFMTDSRSNAYESLVDHLLASPHFGERWGRHWLDMARYADSDGYEKDNARPDAYLWRDWVIDAIQSDMPFDQFTIEQLAGDLLPDASFKQRLATAFHRQTLTNTEGGTDQEQFRVEACFDRTETTGTVWLGLTVGCARCHSHKYDAITQREYYQLFSVFNNGDEQTIVIPKSDSEIAAYAVAKAAYDANVAELSEKLKRAQQDQAPSKELQAQLDELKKQPPPKPELAVRVISQRARDPRQTFVLKRGEFLDPIRDFDVQPATFSTLPPLTSRQHGASADRLDLARWLVSPDNPLTPRVTVNHFWRQLFGQGLVRTPNDFGVRGERPTHPELLDWLAATFIHGGDGRQPWSRKALIKTIVMSATYRQASRHRPELLDSDPQNLLWARQNRLRVEGEIVRDISLDVAGLLSRKIGGPSVYPPLPRGIAELSYAGNFNWTESTGDDRYRRGMYTFFKRTSPHPNLTAFDCPDANLTCIQRQTSNTPLQALTALNNEAFAEASRAFANRMLTLPESAERSRLATAFRRCVARPAQEFELAELQALLRESQDWYIVHPDQALQMIGDAAAPGCSPEVNAAWIATCRILLNLDEFITRE